MIASIVLSIEGIPVIIRFKTKGIIQLTVAQYISIEGIPVIIRFKTLSIFSAIYCVLPVLKVFQL